MANLYTKGYLPPITHHACARVNGRHADLAVANQATETGRCSECGEAIWITPVGRASGLLLICLECLARHAKH